MGKILAILVGLILMVGGIWLAVFVWWQEFRELVFGSIPPLLFLIGIIAFIAGISSIKDAQRTKRLQEETPMEEPTTEKTEQPEEETTEA